MKEKEIYAAKAVAFSVTTLLAATAVWVGMTGVDRDQVSALVGIAWLLASPFLAFEGIRREKLGEHSFGPKPWFRLSLPEFLERQGSRFGLLLSVLFFTSFSVGVVAAHGLAQAINYVISLVLALSCLFTAVILWSAISDASRWGAIGRKRSAGSMARFFTDC